MRNDAGGPNCTATRRDILGGLGGGLLATALATSSSSARAAGQQVIGLIPKFTSDPYFIAANQGGQEAGKELGVRVEYNGPVDANVASQVDIIDRMVRARVDALAVCANDPNALAPAMTRAASRGVKCSTWDADVRQNARQVFLTQATNQAIGETIANSMAADAGQEGNFLLVTASLTASNMVAWTAEIQQLLAKKYPRMIVKEVLVGNEDIEKSKNVTLNYLRANPDTKGVFVVDGIAAIGVSEAVEQLKMQGKVAVAGIGVPSSIRPYIKDGTVKSAVLWNPVDIGYAAIYIAKAQLDGTFNSASGSIKAGRLGQLKFIAPDVLLLGPPLVFTKANIDNYKF